MLNEVKYENRKDENMKRILIIEDEGAYLKLMHDQLLSNGYEVINARDGEEGLKLALTKNPDLILLDLLMPKMDGLKMLRSLNKFKQGKTIPVFILSNVNESNETTEAIKLHASKYYVKSELKLEDLLENIKTYLQ